MRKSFAPQAVEPWLNLTNLMELCETEADVDPKDSAGAGAAAFSQVKHESSPLLESVSRRSVLK